MNFGERGSTKDSEPTETKKREREREIADGNC
jgi:hypothetical protein